MINSITKFKESIPVWVTTPLLLPWERVTVRENHEVSQAGQWRQEASLSSSHQLGPRDLAFWFALALSKQAGNLWEK